MCWSCTHYGGRSNVLQELKSTLGFDHYSFKRFEAVLGWTEAVITTFLYLEYERAKHLADHRVTKDERQWWRSLNGACLVPSRADGTQKKRA